jgi:hypothetical protein
MLGLAAAAAVLGATFTACGASPGTTVAVTRATAPPSSAASTTSSQGTSATLEAPTIVPGGVAVSPGPVATRIPITQTDWGAILDALPDGFPVYPGATVADPPPEPVSASFDATDGVDQVATWYRDAMAAAGYGALDLSDALEDGSRVLDAQSDLPECRIQVTFRPLGGSTMITVLYAAGCVGGAN